MVGVLGDFSLSVVKSICTFSVNSCCKTNSHNIIKYRGITEHSVALSWIKVGFVWCMLMSAPGQDAVGSQHSKECKSAHPACLERLRGTAPSSSELPWLAGSCWHCRHLTWQRGIFWLDCSTDLCVVLSSGTDLCFQLDACWKMRLFFFFIEQVALQWWIK